MGEPIRFTDEELQSHGDDRALYQRLSDRVMSAIGALSIPDALPLTQGLEKLHPE